MHLYFYTKLKVSCSQSIAISVTQHYSILNSDSSGDVSNHVRIFKTNLFNVNFICITDLTAVHHWFIHTLLFLVIYVEYLKKKVFHEDFFNTWSILISLLSNALFTKLSGWVSIQSNPASSHSLSFSQWRHSRISALLISQMFISTFSSTLLILLYKYLVLLYKTIPDENVGISANLWCV